MMLIIIDDDVDVIIDTLFNLAMFECLWLYERNDPLINWLIE